MKTVQGVTKVKEEGRKGRRKVEAEGNLGG
jgi:hypothetical protein